jgi:hypothetical protein
MHLSSHHGCAVSSPDADSPVRARPWTQTALVRVRRYHLLPMTASDSARARNVRPLAASCARAHGPPPAVPRAPAGPGGDRTCRLADANLQLLLCLEAPPDRVEVGGSPGTAVRSSQHELRAGPVRLVGEVFFACSARQARRTATSTRRSVMRRRLLAAFGSAFERGASEDESRATPASTTRVASTRPTRISRPWSPSRQQTPGQRTQPRTMAPGATTRQSREGSHAPGSTQWHQLAAIGTIVARACTEEVSGLNPLRSTTDVQAKRLAHPPLYQPLAAFLQSRC